MSSRSHFPIMGAFAGLAPDLEVISWRDGDRFLFWQSIGGLRFSITEEQVHAAMSEQHITWLILRLVDEAVFAVCDGLEWCSGIWDDLWSMSHGSLSPEVEVLG